MLLLAIGCGASPDTIAAAVITSAVGVTAAGVSRATGGCFASCPVGTTCNEVTGFCEPLPCRGECKEGEVCDEAGPVPKCVARTADIVIETDQGSSPPPEEPKSPE